MIEFKKITIKNFFSIDSITLPFSTGLFFVTGKNNDVPNTGAVSNGAGKTSIFNAVYHAIYGKNLKMKNAAVSSVENIYKPNDDLMLDLTFTINNVLYRVVHKRNKYRGTVDYKIYKDGGLVPEKGVNSNLQFLRNIIGLDYDSFTALTFLNQKSLYSIIDMTNKENILYQVFQLEKLNTIHAKLRERLKEIKADETALKEHISVLEGSLEVASNYSFIDTVQKDKELIKCKAALSTFKVQFNTLKDKYTVDYSKINTKVTDLFQKINIDKERLKHIKNDAKNLKSGHCPLCGGDTKAAFEDKYKEYKSFKATLEASVSTYKDLKAEIDMLSKVYAQSSKRAQSSILKEQEKVDTLTIELVSIKAKNELYTKNLKQKRQLEESIKEKEAALEALLIEKEYLTAVGKVIKSGKILNSYLEKYKKLFEYNLKQYQKFTSFGFIIETIIKKGQVVYNLRDAGQIKNYHTLSSGEMTRVSLLILLATLETLEQLLGLKINYLVFDELFGVLDEEGLTFITKVIKKLKKEKAIFVVNHHNELDSSLADKVYVVEKSNNLTTLGEI